MRHRERGSVFIICLAVLAGLVATMAALSSTQRSVIRAQINRSEGQRARIVAEGAVQRALAELSVTEANQPTTQTDTWYELGHEGADKFIVGSGSFRMQIVDNSSRINLNTAPETQLQNLPLTSEQVSSLLDYREGNRDARPDGAKDEYYNNLPESYNAKLRRYDDVTELLQVKGFTPDVLFNPQTDVVNPASTVQGRAQDQLPLYEMFTVDSYSAQTTADGQTKINVNAGDASAQTIAQRTGLNFLVAQSIVDGRPYARLGDVLARPGVTNANYAAILDNLTINGAARVEGRVNLNTATESTLLSIPGLTTDIVQAILQRQTNGGFTQLSDILAVPGMNAIGVLQQVADAFTTSSQSFLVRAIGTVGSSSVPIEALIVIENNQPRVQQIWDYPLDNPIDRWNWAEEPTNDVTLLEGGR
jgi:general secretion pathway protein K